MGKIGQTEIPLQAFQVLLGLLSLRLHCWSSAWAFWLMSWFLGQVLALRGGGDSGRGHNTLVDSERGQ